MSKVASAGLRKILAVIHSPKGTNSNQRAIYCGSIHHSKTALDI